MNSLQVFNFTMLSAIAIVILIKPFKIQRLMYIILYSLMGNSVKTVLFKLSVKTGTI